MENQLDFSNANTQSLSALAEQGITFGVKPSPKTGSIMLLDRVTGKCLGGVSKVLDPIIRAKHAKEGNEFALDPSWVVSDVAGEDEHGEPTEFKLLHIAGTSTPMWGVSGKVATTAPFKKRA